ncbi:hypothetical protein ACJX0J_042210, partial [Zea mays]
KVINGSMSDARVKAVTMYFKKEARDGVEPHFIDTRYAEEVGDQQQQQQVIILCFAAGKMGAYIFLLFTLVEEIWKDLIGAFVLLNYAFKINVMENITLLKDEVSETFLKDTNLFS